MKADRIKEILLQAGRSLLKVMTRNLGLKILSVVFALMLWSFVISSNTSITRIKTHSGLQGYVSGQSTLDIYNLAMVSDPTSALSSITVDVEVPLTYYSASTDENVHVTLDLSSVRTAGTQEVPIKATTAYGTIKRIYPSSITVTFEPLDSRSIPVNVQLEGREDGYWYNCARVNPANITISGATSIVQDISSIVVTEDVDGHHDSYSTSCTYVLLDSAGNVIPASLLNRSSSSVSLSMEVYPTKELEVSVDAADVLVGQPAEGYVVESITIQPSTITVAADQELLDDLEMLYIDPIEIDSPTQSFTRRATISGLSNIRYISSEQVYVNVQIAEETVSKWFEDVDITFVGMPDGYEFTPEFRTADVYLTGPRSEVEDISAAEITIICDISGLSEGSYSLELEPDTSGSTGVTYQIEPGSVKVKLVPIPEE